MRAPLLRAVIALADEYTSASEAECCAMNSLLVEYLGAGFRMEHTDDRLQRVLDNLAEIASAASRDLDGNGNVNDTPGPPERR